MGIITLEEKKEKLPTIIFVLIVFNLKIRPYFVY